MLHFINDQFNGHLNIDEVFFFPNGEVVLSSSHWVLVKKKLEQYDSVLKVADP